MCPQTQFQHNVAREATIQQLQSEFKKFNSWAALLKHHTDAYALNHCDLAKSIHIAPATLSQYCKNKRLPDSSIVYRLSNALDLSPEAKRIFLQAWRNTKNVRDYIGAIQLALDEGDVDYLNTILTSLSADAQSLLHGTQTSADERG